MMYEQAIRKVKNGKFTDDPNILRLADKEGWTVAHQQAREGWYTDDPEILKLAYYGYDGERVAQEQVVQSDWRTEDPEILRLADHNGVTVAHEQALNGWTTNNPEILELTDNKGETVAAAMKERQRLSYLFN